jgi:hypothetical protein
MNKLRDLNEKDWGIISRALDLYLRCQLGQMGDAFDIFYWEFRERTEKRQDMSQSAKEALIAQVKETLDRAKKEISLSAFASPYASFGVKGLEDPIRHLIIQADLRHCNYADDLNHCPDYKSNQCCAPTTGWCPKRVKKLVLLHPSVSIKEGKFAVVGNHPDLGGGILCWCLTAEDAWENSYAVNECGGQAKAVTREEALAFKE